MRKTNMLTHKIVWKFHCFALTTFHQKFRKNNLFTNSFILCLPSLEFWVWTVSLSRRLAWFPVSHDKNLNVSSGNDKSINRTLLFRITAWAWTFCTFLCCTANLKWNLQVECKYFYKTNIKEDFFFRGYIVVHQTWEKYQITH